MKNWIQNRPKTFTRRTLLGLVAVAMVVSFSAYEFASPARAAEPAAIDTAAPLSDNSVSALLALDQAMETVAARVTPAVVNITVTSKKSDEISGPAIPAATTINCLLPCASSKSSSASASANPCSRNRKLNMARAAVSSSRPTATL